MRLSVLDQSPVPEGSAGPDALRNTLDLARLADRLGYERYWLAEHHGLSLAGPSPEVLIGPVAAATERIRVGSGGVMLAHYDHSFPADHPFARLGHSLPGGEARPEIWLLGSSAQSAVWAAQHAHGLDDRLRTPAAG
jgi:alkanesulfonate monooxygenase SsuD/methylene tetrahydromethanopterin reductase-like flavin-dependent oxidoreductase (luciferase family)